MCNKIVYPSFLLKKRDHDDKNVIAIITLVYKEIEASTKIPVLRVFEGAEFKFEIRFYSSPLVF